MLKLGKIRDKIIMPEGYTSSNAKDKAPPVVDSLVHLTVPDHLTEERTPASEVFPRCIVPSFQNHNT